MNKLIKTGIISTFLISPLALAADFQDDVRRALEVGADYGITHFQNIELDDDGDDQMEIEGWLDSQWYVELDVLGNGDIQNENRQNRGQGPNGLSAEQTLEYLNIASEHGMERIEEITIDAGGLIAIEGLHRNGRELELDFNRDSLEPIRSEQDD